MDHKSIPVIGGPLHGKSATGEDHRVLRCPGKANTHISWYDGQTVPDPVHIPIHEYSKERVAWSAPGIHLDAVAWVHMNSKDITSRLLLSHVLAHLLEPRGEGDQ
jgi:hypothetical protein